MSDVPKFVRQKLAQQPAGEHPDANVLAAFVEDALGKPERAQVMTHLSACAACRETVALALPEVPGAAPEPAPVVSLWTRWPMLRWAGVTVAAVAVAAAVMIQDMRKTASTAQFRYESPATQAPSKQPEAPVAEEKSAPIEAKSDQIRESRSQGRNDKTTRSFDSHARHQPALPNTGARGPAGASSLSMTPLQASTDLPQEKKKDAAEGGLMTSLHGSFGATSNELARSPVPAPPPAKAAPLVSPPSTAEAVALAPGAAGAAVTDQAKQQRNPAPPAANAVSVDEFRQAEVVSAQPQAEMKRKSTAINGVVGGAAPGPPMAKAVYSTGTPRWRISGEGAVERSLDAGQSWQRMAVAGAREMFRSMAVVGNDVWAGGVRGALYHSSDNGRTWKRVPVQAGDEALEADIVRVEFTDAQHGFLTTTAGETWSTGDGGATWSAGRR